MRHMVWTLVLGISVGFTTFAANAEVSIEDLNQLLEMESESPKEASETNTDLDALADALDENANATQSNALAAQCDFPEGELEISCELGYSDKIKLLAYKASGGLFGDDNLLPNVIASELDKANLQMKINPMYDQIALQVIPFKYIANQNDYCKGRAETTESKPRSFTDLEFKNVDGIRDWVSELSLSREVNNEFCPNTCSPYYKATIQAKGDKLVVDANVYCGLERDMNDEVNYYNVSTSLKKSE